MSSSSNPQSNQPALQELVVERRPIKFYYTKLRGNALLVLSIFNFLLWSTSTALQASGITFANGISYYHDPAHYHSSEYLLFPQNNYGDTISFGIWCAIFYMLTAFFGYSSSYTPTRKLLISTLVFSTLSLVGAVMTCVTAKNTEAFQCILFSSYPAERFNWTSIENSLVVISLFASVNNFIILILVSMAIHSGPQTMSDSASMPYRHQHFDDRQELPIVMITNPASLVQCQVVYQQTHPIESTGQPK